MDEHEVFDTGQADFDESVSEEVAELRAALRRCLILRHREQHPANVPFDDCVDQQCVEGRQLLRS